MYLLCPGDLIDHPRQALQNVNPTLIDKEQISRKEENADDHDDRRILYIIRGWKRGLIHLGPSLLNKLADAFLLFSLNYCF